MEVPKATLGRVYTHTQQINLMTGFALETRESNTWKIIKAKDSEYIYIEPYNYNSKEKYLLNFPPAQL